MCWTDTTKRRLFFMRGCMGSLGSTFKHWVFTLMVLESGLVLCRSRDVDIGATFSDDHKILRTPIACSTASHLPRSWFTSEHDLASQPIAARRVTCLLFPLLPFPIYFLSQSPIFLSPIHILYSDRHIFLLNIHIYFYQNIWMWVCVNVHGKYVSIWNVCERARINYVLYGPSHLSLPSIYPFSFAYLKSGGGGSWLSRVFWASSVLATHSSFSLGTPRSSQASRGI